MAAPDLMEACKRLALLASLVTAGQVVEAGDRFIEAAGLNPYCLNEGANPDTTIECWFAEEAISKAEGNEK